MNILVMNGVNMNMLGKRDPAQYGGETLDDVNRKISALAAGLGARVEFFQSNLEGAFVERVHAAHTDGTQGLIVNPAAWSHYSVALRDALEILNIPIVEVHLSNIHKREEFRHKSLVSALAKGVICGLGAEGYLLALRFLVGQKAN